MIKYTYIAILGHKKCISQRGSNVFLRGGGGGISVTTHLRKMFHSPCSVSLRYNTRYCISSATSCYVVIGGVRNFVVNACMKFLMLCDFDQPVISIGRLKYVVLVVKLGEIFRQGAKIQILFILDQ